MEWQNLRNAAPFISGKTNEVIATISSAILAFAFLGSLLYGRVPQPYLLLICALLGVSIALAGRHKHSDVMSIDVLSQTSRLKNVNPMFKFITLFALMIICIASGSAMPGLFLLAVMLILAVPVGGLPLHKYITILALPFTFLLIGGLALLFEVYPEPAGVLNINVFGFWLCVSEATQVRTALIVSRALGAVSCLCLLNVTTPMPDIIGVLRRVKCPELIIDLMYLIYRYIFILLSMHHEMRDAAKSRLGFRDYRSSLRATASIYSNLLARSYQFAGKNFDAMESRCYETGIKFLERRIEIRTAHVFVAVMLLAATVILCFWPL